MRHKLAQVLATSTCIILLLPFSNLAVKAQGDPASGTSAQVVSPEDPVAQPEQEPSADEAKATPDADELKADNDAEGDGRSDWFVRYVLPALISLFGVGVVIYFTRRNLIADHWLKTNALEIEYIQRRLDRFWGPYLVMSDSHHLLAQDIRNRQSSPESYRMLPSLFDESWLASLSPGDRQLVRDICENGERLSKHIIENSGLIEFRLLPFLSRAIAHWRVLHLAAEGKLGDDPTVYLRYVYPRSLDEAVKREIVRLSSRLATLRADPSKPHGEIPVLDLSDVELDPWPDPSRARYKEGEGIVPDPAKSKSLWESLEELNPAPLKASVNHAPRQTTQDAA